MGCVPSRNAVAPPESIESAGVTLACLKDILAQISGCATSTMIDSFIKPATARRQESYAQLLRRKGRCDLNGVPFVGTARCMISHAWGGDFHDLVRSVESHVSQQSDPAQYYVLLDFCCLNQHEIAVKLHNPDTTFDVLKITLTAMVTGPRDNTLVLALDTWDEPLLLRRCWCLFEVAMAVKSNVKVVGTLPKEKLQLLYSAISESFESVANKLAQIDVERASSTQPQVSVLAIVRLVEPHLLSSCPFLLIIAGLAFRTRP